MMSRVRAVLHASAALLVLPLAAPVHAQDEEPPAESEMPGPMEVQEQEETAKAHFNVGKSLYDSGRFREAAEEWEKALEISGKSELAYNIYVAYRDASDLPRAITALERYLESSEVDPQLRINLQARLDAMRRTVASQQQQQPEPAPEPVAPPPAPEPEPQPPPPEPAAMSVEPNDSIAPYVIMGVGGAMVVAGVITGIVANSKVNDIEDHCPMDRCPPSYDLDADRDSAKLLVSVTDALLIGGLVTAGIGAVLALVAEKDSPAAPADPATEPAAALGCGADGCALELRGSF